MPRWTPEARQRQRELIQSWVPWQYSTGPTSTEGKAIACQNARLKGRRAEVRAVLEDAKQAMRLLRQLDRERRALLHQKRRF